MCMALPKAKVTRDYKGHLTGQTTEETTWYLVSDLSARWDIARIYVLRMQIEMV